MEALNAVGQEGRCVCSVNTAVTSPVCVPRRAGWCSPRLKDQLDLLLLLVCSALSSHDSQSLPGCVLVSAVGQAGVDLHSKETRAN